ncbi:MAG TPA: DHH family phosphoesterase [Candidatus Peribacterales bacterium]|nr:DHH family phosphoesterase [Candidatus Peribacterales bacterium]
MASHSYADLLDPLQLGEMTSAVERIRSAVKQKETIGIIGDYDADGITGTAQLVRFFRRHGIEPHVILPHRQRDGYGIKKSFIDALHAKGVTLILTVDTGISHAAEIAYARSLGIESIVTDHHSLHGELPNAIILHPKTPQPHQNAALCGSGVVFTLIRALENDQWEGKEIDLALAMVGTIADVVPLTGENRTIVRLGLGAMNRMFSSPACQGGSESACGGRIEKDAPIFRLARSIVKDHEPITSTHIGFRLAPRINASGRLANPMIALRGILEGGDDLERLHTLNAERQEATVRMMEIADELMTDSLILMLRSPMFHAGIIGLIAGRLTEKTGKPSVVACEEGDKITCSLRSIPVYHIVEALSRCGALLTSFGGHREAGGCTLHADHWDAFKAAMEQDIVEQCGGRDFAPVVEIDAEINTENLSLSLVQSLSALEPYGAANPEPKFLLRMQEAESLRQVGSDGQHLQCVFGGVKAIGFGLGRFVQSFPDRCDIVCRLGVDTWNGHEKVQLFLEDIAKAGKTVADSFDRSVEIK